MGTHNNNNKQTQYASSSSDTFDSSSSPSNQKPAIPNTDNNSSSSHNISFVKEASQSSLPKLLFAEWLSLDHSQTGVPTNSGDDSLVFRNDGNFDQYSDFQEAAMHHSVSHGGTYDMEFHNGLTTPSAAAANEIFNSEFKFSNQMVGNGIIHFPSFSMTNDVMYI